MTSVNGDRSRTQVWDVFSEALMLFDRKNADYGDAWRSNGWRGNLSRIFEKDQRVRNLLWRNDPRTPAVGDEAAVETLVDMLNTIAFAIVNLRDGVEWGHETPRSLQALQYHQQQRPPQPEGSAESTSVGLFKPVLDPAAGAELVVGGPVIVVNEGEESGPAAVPGGRRRATEGRVVRDNPQA